MSYSGKKKVLRNTVPCPTCGGKGGSKTVLRIETNQHGDPDDAVELVCLDCKGTGEVKRELAAVLEACEARRPLIEGHILLDSGERDLALQVLDALEAWAREQWGSPYG